MSGLSAFAAPILDHRGRLVLAMTVLDYSRDWDHRIGRRRRPGRCCKPSAGSRLRWEGSRHDAAYAAPQHRPEHARFDGARLLLTISVKRFR